VTHHSQELAFGSVGGFGYTFGLPEFFFSTFSFGDISEEVDFYFFTV